MPTLWWLDECPLRRVVTTVGINLAKNVFQLHGVNEFGKPVIKKQIRRDQMAEFFLNLPACLIGMEACGSAHHWARKLQGFGFSTSLSHVALEGVVIALPVELTAACQIKPHANCNQRPDIYSLIDSCSRTFHGGYKLI